MYHETHLQLLMVRLKDPVLHDLAVFVEVKEVGELEALDHNLAKPIRVAPSQVFE